MLSVRNRQAYLKALGFYDGKVDGDAGPKTKAAYAALQDKYFPKDHRDGKYGTNTDKLLQNAYRVFMYCKNFRLEEFKCQCGGKYCTGYPAILNIQLLTNVQLLRDKHGSTVITSPLRCSKHNSMVGGSLISRHKSGKALDIKGAYTKTENERKSVMEYWMSLPNARYTYCNIGGNYPNMGNSVHVDVK